MTPVTAGWVSALRRAPMSAGPHECDRHAGARRGPRLPCVPARELGARERHLDVAARCRLHALSRRKGRGSVLGRDPRALPFHLARQLSVRRAMAAGGGLCAVRLAVCDERQTRLVDTLAAGAVGGPADERDRAAPRRRFGLDEVPSEFWGGLPLTFLLSTVGFAAAFPLAVVLALGRRSQMPAIRVLSIAYIEIVRGVPLVTFLFMASVMFPLFVSPGVTVDKVLRAQIAFVIVIAAYVAEVVRAGLAAVPKGQYEAAASLGLRFWPATTLVVLPQALRVSIPALVNTFIGFFKDTSLVTVIGLFDLLGAAKAVLTDAKWVGFGVEIYLFAAAVYFVFCWAISRYSQYLERALLARSHQ